MEKFMKKIGYLFLSCFAFLVITHCTKESDFVTMNYSESKCSDAWNTNENSSEEEVKAALKDYFITELKVGYIKLEIIFDEELAQDCEACSCTTGRIIAVDVAESHIATLEDNGFVLKN